MIAVLGATGTVGGKVAAMLLEQGIPVRAMVRDPEKAKPLRDEGAEIVVGNMLNIDDLRNAFDRCDGAFLLTPRNVKSEDPVEEEIEIGKNYGRALMDSTVGHVVHLSVIAARQNTGIPHFDSKRWVEDSIASGEVDVTFLRPTFFMENLLKQLPLMQEMGMISLPLPPDASIPMVATDDVAYAAVESLKGGGCGCAEYDLLGPKNYTMLEVAEIVGRAVGKDIRYYQLPDDQAVDKFMQHGMTRRAAEETLTMFRLYEKWNSIGDRAKVYSEFNFDPTSLETVISPLAGAVRT